MVNLILWEDKLLLRDMFLSSKSALDYLETGTTEKYY